LANQGVEATVEVGTTGESTTIPPDEHIEMVRWAVKFSPIPVIAGAGANSTEEAVHLTRESEQAGARAILSVVPYYNKPNQEGLYRHFVKICQSTGLPVLVYNVPGRTVREIPPKVTLRIRDKCPNMVGIKEATSNTTNVHRYVREGLPVFCGEDAMNFPMLCLGAQGVISVVSNFAPHVVSDLIQRVREERLSDARSINKAMVDLSEAAFVDSNPIPVKYICSLLGFCEDRFRLPMTPLSQALRKKVRAAVSKYVPLTRILK